MASRHPAEPTRYFDLVLRSERFVGLPAKLAMLLIGLYVLRSAAQMSTQQLLAVGIVLYAISTLYFAFLLFARPREVERLGRGVFFTFYLLDIALAALIIYVSGPASDSLFLLVLLAFKSVLYYPLWHDVFLFTLALGPLALAILRLNLQSWNFVADPFVLRRYLLLLSAVLASLYLSWLNEHSQTLQVRLRRSLDERTADLDSKTRAMQQMATSLGNRVLELRTLQEGVKAINSALALEDVLRLIVANASQVLEGARCSVALLDESPERVTSTAASDGRTASLAELDHAVVSWMAGRGEPLMIEDLRHDERFDLQGLPLASAIGVPLLLDEQVIGALIATSIEPRAFSGEDVNQLNAFADQAVVAVKNARLYEQLVQEQRETERVYQHVQERRNELEAILRAIGDAVIVADAQLNLLLMNPVATRIFGVKPDVTSSMPLSQVIQHQDLNELLVSALNGEHGEALVKEILLPSADGQSSPTLQALASPIQAADGQPRGVVVVLRDVTSQKELERMKSSFLSVVSHELRTPLHSIKGFVDIILMGKTGEINETQTDFLRTVRQQTTHLQNLIDDLLEYSRLESGQVKLRLSEVSLTEVANAVIDKLKPLADQGQIRLLNKLPSRLASVEADRLRLEQVLTNLIDNAIKFTPPGGAITVLGKDLGADLQISVSDTGIGIPASALERIFDRFFQVDSSASRSYRGTGLGLTICKHIVEHHRGRIWAESEPNKGSTFHFVLPKRLSAKDDELLLDFLVLPKSRKRRGNSAH